MHIHPGNMNPVNASMSGAQAAQAARRAEETRKKLLDAASTLEATATAESAWMIGAWAGQSNSPGASHRDGGQGHPGGATEPVDSIQASRAAAIAEVRPEARFEARPEIRPETGATPAAASAQRPPSSNPVSYWA